MRDKDILIGRLEKVITALRTDARTVPAAVAYLQGDACKFPEAQQTLSHRAAGNCRYGVDDD